ncbi:MAG: AmmeMemoRadiSam system radical SAM enzyme [Candidatus Omnitrophica bacterium]|nr:AmmeMemoRadiSam system radical SAM enzyme [Candidatus Omnitrophota bacterium]
MQKEASYYQKKKSGKVQCLLCPKNCIIACGEAANCRARKNIDGTLYSLVYGKTTGLAVDPIEKKPLYHFHPGEFILSLGTRGCNLACVFCQNWQISQNPDAHLEDITKEEIVTEAIRLNTFGIAYTYNEPFIWYEFVRDTAMLAKENGLENVLVTNGYVAPEPLAELLPLIGAMNIDLKAMDDQFYRSICKATLDPVLNTIKRAKQSTHVELTNLIIPTLNDSDEQIEKLTEWVFNNTGADTPLHFSRYFPCYKLNLAPTPLETLKRAKAIAEKKLKHVYLGNV